MGQIFNSGLDIYATDGSRIVWSSTRRPALLVPSAAVTIPNFEIAYPDFSKSNAYGFTYVDTPIVRTACISFASINPQNWDSGLGYVCDVPAGTNYFEIEMSLSHITIPSPWLGVAIPELLGINIMPDGDCALIEGIGPMLRMFSFERSGNSIYLRRKQSVSDNGGVPSVPWNSDNDNTSGGGGYEAGFTYGGNPLAWPAFLLDSKDGTSALPKRRGESNACSLVDTSNYSSLWRGTLKCTPGYIAP